VDNVRTHSAKEYDVNLISKSPNTNCPYETIEWNEDGITKSVECFDSNNISKGLLQIAKELGIIEKNTSSREIKFPEIRERVCLHHAFSNITK